MTDVTAAAIEARRGWRPQRFGRRNTKSIVDPVVEPLWQGVRVLAHLEADRSVRFFDEDGESLTADEERDVEAIALALREALAADSATLDGYLTPQPTRPGEGVTIDSPQTMSGTEMIGHFLVGGMASGRARNRLEEGPERPPVPQETGSPLAFVAVDLLELDGEPVLDVPLLERKRLLASVVGERTLVRLTPYVRLPIDTWIVSWRAAGFHGLAYKAANSRYRPGAQSDDWATTAMPAR